MVEFFSKCGRRDSNPHASRHQILSLDCLPISTRPQSVLVSLTKGLQRYDKLSFLQIIHTRLYDHFWLEAESKTDTEAHGNVGIYFSEPVPEFETMMIKCL